jgi:hypothetical protein
MLLTELEKKLLKKKVSASSDLTKKNEFLYVDIAALWEHTAWLCYSSSISGKPNKTLFIYRIL